MRRFLLLVLVANAISFNAAAQLLEVAELSVRDIEKLDRDQTVVVLSLPQSFRDKSSQRC